MFTWICPQCGREVPPSYSECPDCAERAKTPAAAQPPPAAGAPAAQPPSASPSPASPPSTAAAPAAAAPPPQVIYVQKRGQPGWLIALLVAVGLVVAGAAGYYFLLPSARAQRGAGAEEQAVMEEPGPAGSQIPPTTAARMARLLEVTGLRILEEDKRPQIRYVVVNHSAADLAGLKGDVILRSSKAAADADPIAVVPMEVPSLRAYEVKEIIAPLKSKLRAYEYPDWQFLKADLQLTAP
jgi:hypothetical protein